ncbi:MAG: response regulator [Pseudomonadota bacterium]
MAYKILIVEDNPVQMKLATKMLEKIENLEIFQAGDGIQARECLEKNKIEIVLCDIGLPGESGLDLTRYMVQTYKDIIVIMLTADEDLSTSEKAIEYGAFQYLVKPVKPSQLRISIQTALRIWKFQQVIKTQRSVLKAEIEHLEQTKQKLGNSQAEFNALFDNIQEGFYRVDQEGRLVMANPACLKILGFDSFDDINGRNIIEFYQYPEDREVLLEAIFKAGSLAAYEVNLKRRDDQVITVLVNAYVRKDKDNQPLGIEGTIVDISARKRMESELSQAQKLESIGHLAAGIAHEINTPIQYVGDNTNFMKEAFDDLFKIVEPLNELLCAAKNNQISDELIERMEDAIQDADIEYLSEEIPVAISQSLDGIKRVSQIVKSMKEFSHPGGETSVLTDINHAIENTVTVARNEWKYVADLNLDLDDTLPQILCNPGEINQVILNMIINASHAIGDVVADYPEGKGKITIQTRHNEKTIDIVIHDNGPGIPQHIIDKIFDPFFTTKEVGKGTGQGLAISRSVIVDKHKGSIKVDSQKGKGTSFIICLPR